MLRELMQFFKKEKFYTVLLVFIIVMYLFVFLGRQKQEPSEQLKKIRQAETIIKEKLEEGEPLAGGIVPFTPSFLFFSLFTLLLMVVLLVGIILDIAGLVQIVKPRPPEALQDRIPPGSWDLIDCIRVVLLFLCFAILLSIFLAVVKRIFFHGATENAFLILHTTLVDIAAVFFIVYIISRRYREGLKQLGLGIGNFVKNIFTGLVGYLKVLPIFMGVLLLVVFITQMFDIEPPPHPIVEVFVEEQARNPLLIVYSVLLACVVGPIIEEIFFRGFCYPALKRRWGIATGLIVTAVFFAIVHWSPFAFLPVFILGLALGYLYEKKGSLVPSIILHIAHNSIFIGYFFLVKHALLDKVV